MFKLQGRKSACTTCAGSSEILRWLTPFLGPNMDPKWGPELDHIFIPSFRSLLGPRFGIQIWTQKWGQPSENFAAARRGFASRFATHQHERSVNTCFFSLCVPLCFLYSMSLACDRMMTPIFEKAAVSSGIVCAIALGWRQGCGREQLKPSHLQGDGGNKPSGLALSIHSDRQEKLVGELLRRV